MPCEVGLFGTGSRNSHLGMFSMVDGTDNVSLAFFCFASFCLFCTCVVLISCYGLLWHVALHFVVSDVLQHFCNILRGNA